MDRRVYANTKCTKDSATAAESERFTKPRTKARVKLPQQLNKGKRVKRGKRGSNHKRRTGKNKYKVNKILFTDNHKKKWEGMN